jgi:nucleoside-diphosphate-sugar epimerase
MIALVTGANGCIGYALLEKLLASGDYAEVRALIRRPTAAGDLPQGVAPFHGDLGDRRALEAATAGVAAVFHAAAKVHDPDGDAAAFDRVNIVGTQNLVDACAASGRAPTFVLFSTVAVYGESTPAAGLSEDAPIAPHSPYARSKVAAEKIVHAYGARTGAVTVCLRVATVYGPRDRGNMQRMIDSLARKRYVSLGRGDNRKTCAAVRNVAHAAWACGQATAQSVVKGRNIIVADPEPDTLRNLESSICVALGIMEQHKGNRRNPVPFPSVPRWIALAAAAGAESAVRLLPGIRKRLPISPAQVRRLTAENVYLLGTLPQVPGYLPVPVASLEQGMAEAVEWYRHKQADIR